MAIRSQSSILPDPKIITTHNLYEQIISLTATRTNKIKNIRLKLLIIDPPLKTQPINEPISKKDLLILTQITLNNLVTISSQFNSRCLG
jgi:hypothetical protein